MKSLFIRYSIALLVAAGSGLFSFLFLPLTFFFSVLLLGLFYSFTVNGMTVFFEQVTFTFIPACAATLAYIFLLELILLTRGISFFQGVKLFLIGGAMIFFLNITRIIFLVFLYVEFGKNYFDLVHLFFWHFVSTVFVAVVWIFLVEKYKLKSIPIWSDVKEILKKS